MYLETVSVISKKFWEDSFMTQDIHKICKFWVFHSGENSHYDLLGYNVVT
jgi:hypothetical protein